MAAILALLPVAALAQLRAEPVVSGLERPLAIVADPLSPNTLVVAQRNGLVLALVDGVVQPTPFLDLRGVVTDDGEQGLLGIVFSPHDPNVVFACFSNRRDPSLPFPTLEWGDTVIARFRRSADPLVVAPETRFDLVWPPPLPGMSNFPFIYQPFDVHKGGNLVFGPDGMLYIGIGDGGAGGNTPAFHAQHPQSLLGKMLRVDVRVPDGSARGYVVPPDNPFLDGRPIAALGEIWAFGYRNPWRFSFDDFGPGATGAMIVADVGLDEREEIDYEPFGRGGRNYGWYVREGSIVTPGISPATPLAFSPLTNPIVDYPHTVGRSITGGFVYRGNALPSLYRGRYFFGDFFGRVFSIGLTIDGAGEAQFADVLEHTSELGNPRLITTFGRGLDGELYYSSFTDGSIHKIVADTPPLPAAPSPFTATVRGSTVSLAWQPNLSLGPVLGYQIEAGSQPGTNDLAVLEMLSSSLVVPGVPNGLYHLRVRALNASGASAPSQELTVRVGCGGVMPFPTGLTAQVGAGGFVSLVWNPTAEATSYLIEAGTVSGASNLGIIPVAGTTIGGAIAPGTYFVRVRAVTSCGTSDASSEVVVQVP